MAPAGPDYGALVQTAASTNEVQMATLKEVQAKMIDKLVEGYDDVDKRAALLGRVVHGIQDMSETLNERLAEALVMGRRNLSGLEPADEQFHASRVLEARSRIEDLKSFNEVFRSHPVVIDTKLELQARQEQERQKRRTDPMQAVIDHLKRAHPGVDVSVLEVMFPNINMKGGA